MVIPRCGQPLAHIKSTLEAPYNFILQTLSIFFSIFYLLLQIFYSVIYTWGDIYIDNVNGQSKIISKRGSEGGVGGGRRREDGDGRRQQTSGDLENFWAMKGVMCPFP